MLIASVGQYFFGITIFVTSMFLIMLVLVQRGRGGGLTGALGGPGGQSAFGTKAGDLFTRITVGVAAVWILLCASSVYFLKSRPLPSTGLSASDTSFASPGDSSDASSATTTTSENSSAIVVPPAADDVEAEITNFPLDPAAAPSGNPAAGDTVPAGAEDTETGPSLQPPTTPDTP